MEMKREQWIDVAKGIGILAIMISHTPFGGDNYWLFSFQVPLFFVLSGFCFRENKYTTKEFFCKKIRNMLIMYFFLGIVLAIGIELTTNLHHPKLFYYIVGAMKSVIYQCRFSTLWFLSLLIVIEIIYFFICKIISNDFIRLIVVLFFLGLAVVYNFYVKIPLPWNVDLFGMALFFYWCGTFLNRHRRDFEKICTPPYLIFLFGIFFLGVLVNYIVKADYFEMYGSEFGLLPISIIIVFAQIGIVFILSKSLPTKILTYIGRNSVVYFAWHQAITFNLLIAFMGRWNLSREQNYYLFCLIEVVGSLCILTVVNEIILRTPLKKLIGR